MKAVVAAFNKEKALVGAFSVITKLRMELFQALEVKSVCWKMLCVQYFKNFLQHGPTESTRVKCRQFQCRVIFIYDVKVGGERRSHASLG